jgi:hypothetical protein
MKHQTSIHIFLKFQNIKTQLMLQTQLMLYTQIML